ncbi:hypothetical protein TNIN_92551 [Trichonephila inaurata madagascariensis]|uniref:Uncharacterized protein n=1 Tax=Trichonephila inaurata madagascariensis TaxID=2747483 RepID=A0A8X7CGM2_9ARAC|nr:hypothetical protein TNIN_92551 [Trichonephila inaurata madagascariensis]
MERNKGHGDWHRTRRCTQSQIVIQSLRLYSANSLGEQRDELTRMEMTCLDIKVGFTASEAATAVKMVVQERLLRQNVFAIASANVLGAVNSQLYA